MPDDVLDLSPLAPEVDLPASRAVFERRRSQSRRRHRLARAVGAVALVSGLTGLAVVVWPDDADEVSTGPSGEPAAEPAPFTFEVLQVAEAGDEMGRLRAAVDAEQLEAIWVDAGLPGRPDPTDFERWVVVTITIPDDACPPTLTDFDVTGDEPSTITPVFVETVAVCNRPLIPKTYVVAVDRAWAGPGFTLRLPGDAVYGFGEQRLEVVVPEATDGSSATTGTTSSPTDGLTDAQRPVVVAFIQFTKSPTPEQASTVPFAPEVGLGLGSQLLTTLDASSFGEPTAWELDLELRWGRTGSVSALELLGSTALVEVEPDRQTACGSVPPLAPPDGLDGATRVSLLASGAGEQTCLDWFAVDLYLDGENRIVAVTIELYEP